MSIFFMLLFVFMYVDVIVFLRILRPYSFVNQYMLDDLSAKVKAYLTNSSFLCLLSVRFEAGFSLFECFYQFISFKFKRISS